MGWWSATIMGGDTPQDVYEDIIEMVNAVDHIDDGGDPEGGDLDDKVWARAVDAGVKATSESEWLEFIESNDDPEIAAQVVAVVLMQHGAPLPASVVAQAVEASMDEDLDDWGDSADERRGYLSHFMETMNTYNGTPTDLPYEGLFDKIAEALIPPMIRK